MAATTAPGRRTVLVAIILLALTLRPAVTTTSALLPRIVDGVPLSVTQAGLLGSLPPFCFAVAGVVARWLARRTSAERIAAGLLLVAAVALVARPWAPGAWPFLAVSVVALVATGVGNVVLPPIVKAWFPDRIPAVTATYLIWLTLGTALPPLAAVSAADAVGRRTGSDLTGWRVALAMWGALAAIALPLWLRPAAHPKVLPAATGGDAHPHLPMWRSRVAWGVTLVFGFQSFAAYVCFTWIPTRLVDAGIGDGEAALMLAIFAGMGLPAAIVVPRLAARIPSTALLVVGLASLFGGGLVWLAFAPRTLTLLVILAMGVGSGLFPLALTLVNLRTRTPLAAGSLSAFAQGTGYLVAGAGPFVAGAVHDATGSWEIPFTLAALAMIPVVGGGLLAGRRSVEDDLAPSRPVTLEG